MTMSNENEVELKGEAENTNEINFKSDFLFKKTNAI